MKFILILGVKIENAFKPFEERNGGYQTHVELQGFQDLALKYD